MDHLDDKIYALFDRLASALVEIKGAELRRHFITSQKNHTLILEAVILRNGELLAVVESRPYVEKLELTEVINRRFLEELAYKYLVITNGIEIILCNTYNGTSITVETEDKLITAIFDLPSDEEIKSIKAQIAQVLEQESRNFSDKIEVNRTESNKYQLVKTHFRFQRTIDELHFDKNGQFFRLGTDIRLPENFENILFNILLEDLPVGTLIYRYASLETVFATINNGSMRMNGIVGMNDTSEVEYVDRYLDKSYDLYTNPDEIKAMNKRFITCCSRLKDTLNQWRLYGDDCKGACLVFRINASQNLPGLKIKKVSYGRLRNGQPYHTELELIKRLIEKVREITGESLKFKSIGIWKHFFKSHEYKEEEEIRLLLALNNISDIKGSTHAFERKWNLTSSHKIIAPFITVPLIEPLLPISLERITLGSKSPEKQVNQAQLTLLLEEKKMPHVKVDLSSINNYR